MVPVPGPTGRTGRSGPVLITMPPMGPPSTTLVTPPTTPATPIEGWTAGGAPPPYLRDPWQPRSGVGSQAGCPHRLLQSK
ncbi:hypothetical protein CRG98_024939 [Punica granatum]|uniref:Uncharacterized protein n=1 Tax=Punica granatum TaxID=22663 RepID=A0A2I0JEJ8_PUNGR|nr:hypothetical protein CRG98_024939 [Punica granatum]